MRTASRAQLKCSESICGRGEDIRDQLQAIATALHKKLVVAYELCQEATGETVRNAVRIIPLPLVSSN